MLRPDSRTTVIEAMQPPTGFALDVAVGTTYSLDLEMMLTVPFALTFFERTEERGTPQDPVLLWESLRRYAGRLLVFCQAGQIGAQVRSTQVRGSPLFGYLEEAVVEVAVPGGVFHPKVWLLRYARDGCRPRYRLLCMSRNLTMSRSWDVLCVLEGELTGRTNAYSRNHPLGDFVQALPELALRPLAPGHQERIDTLQHEVRRVDFQLPSNVEEMRFWPLGLKRRRQGPFDTRIDRLLIVSPFLSRGRIRRLAHRGSGNVLFSRPDSLDDLGRTLAEAFEAVYVLDEGAVPQPEDTDEAEPPPRGRARQSNLHAKLFVAEAGWDARVWLGSANATEAAFSTNIEFLVELRGKKSRLGIDAFLGAGDEALGFRSLLQRYVPEGEPSDDAEARRLEQALRKAKRALAEAPWEVHVSQEEGQDTYAVVVRCAEEAPTLPLDAEVACWPITLRDDQRQPLEGAPREASFSGVSLAGLTSFVAFEVRVDHEGRPMTERFALNLPLLGAPRDRTERTLRLILQRPEDVGRLIRLLLADEAAPMGMAQEMLLRGAGGGAAKGASPSRAPFPLLEVMLRSLHRDPSKLDRVQRLVATLRQEHGDDLFPPGFERVWDALTTAREQLT